MGQKLRNQHFQKFNSREVVLPIILAPILMKFGHFSKFSMTFNMGVKWLSNSVWAGFGTPFYPHIENHAGFRKMIEFHQNRRQNDRKTHLFRIKFLEILIWSFLAHFGALDRILRKFREIFNPKIPIFGTFENFWNRSGKVETSKFLINFQACFS